MGITNPRKEMKLRGAKGEDMGGKTNRKKNVRSAVGLIKSMFDVGFSDAPS